MEILGLKTCDSCRKAKAKLEAAGHAVRLRDLRAEPLTQAEAARLVATFGDAAINRKSTTWRGLDAAAREADPVALLVQHPALMKRPVIVAGETWRAGWGAELDRIAAPG